jgi:hypothetical protein
MADALMPTPRKEMIRQGSSAHREQDPGGWGAERLTDLLTRRCRTRETARDVGDDHYLDSLISETRRDVGDGGDARRGAHNPEVAGSNPAPATMVRGLFRSRKGPLACGL